MTSSPLSLPWNFGNNKPMTFVCCVVHRKHQHIFYVAATQVERNGDHAPFPNSEQQWPIKICEWFDTGDVQIGSYPIAFHSALISQTQIGWQHLFMGHWSTECEELHDSMTTSKGQTHLWTATMGKLVCNWWYKYGNNAIRMHMANMILSKNKNASNGREQS